VVSDPTTRSRRMRCPQCSGLNARDADWCGQCGRRFRAAEPAARPEGMGEKPSYLASLAEIVGAEEDSDPEGMERVFAVSKDGATWVCARCYKKNSMAAATCASCEMPFRDTARLVVEGELAERLRARDDAVADTLMSSTAAVAGGPVAIPFVVASLIARALKSVLRLITRNRRL
jgi:ribosomal protein L40E